jgi:Kef-type K+ transport system membrane component KefB
MNSIDFLQQASESVTYSQQPYTLLLPIALILFFAKLLSIWLGKIHFPQVIGFLVAGLLVGTISLFDHGFVFNPYTESGIDILAKFGVVLILFTAGLETDLKQVKAVGWESGVITSLGVIAPLLLGFFAAWAFGMGDKMVVTMADLRGVSADDFLALYPGFNIYSNLYYGVILSATSVSITVATLKELNRLDTKVGMAIVSAAIIDDVIGIILLSLVISLAGGSSSVTYVANNSGLNILVLVLVMISFFVMSIIAGVFIRRLFNWLGKKYPEHRRIPIFSLALCFLWAYLAQQFFNIADITGGYVMGLILSTTKPKDYIDRRSESTANVFFIPIFFASVALKMYENPSGFDFSDLSFLWFGLVWIVAGLLGKVIGAGSGAFMCRFSFKDSLKIGVGMMARAEVLIVCAQTGVDAGLVSGQIIPYTLALILISSFLTPILLKALYKGEDLSISGDRPTPPDAPSASN